jgi:hypothetical protein
MDRYCEGLTVFPLTARAWQTSILFITLMLGMVVGATSANAQFGGTAAGNVSIGTTTASSSMLGVYGGITVGSSYAPGTAAPANGAIIQGNVGIGSTSPIASLDLSQKVDALALPVGTTGARPTGTALTNGEIRYNATTPGLEAYINGGWSNILASTIGTSSVTGTGTTNYVARWTSSTGLGTGVLVDVGTAVGIGTITPSTPLQVAGTVTATTFSGSGALLTSIPSTALAALSANQVLGSVTASAPSGLALPSCSTTASALTWASGTGFQCNTGINAAQLNGTTFAAPGAIGATTAGSAAFTSLSATSTVSGAGFSSYLASPPAIGGTVASAGNFTSLGAKGVITDTQSIGTTSSDGLVLTNVTAAASGSQQWSPRIHFNGRGWETNTSASQSVDMIAELQPIQGGTNPSGNLVWSSSINGGAYAALLTLTTGGNVGIGTTTPSSPLTVNGTVTAITFAGSGASLTNINASNLSAGTVPAAQMGSGTPSNTTYLRGDQTWAVLPGGTTTFGALTSGDFCTATSGTSISCTTATISLATQASGTLQASQEPAHTGDVTNAAGSLALGVTAIQGTTVSGVTGSGNVVFSSSPTLTGTVTGGASNWSGNVGIGTTGPADLFDVSNATNTGNIVLSLFSSPSLANGSRVSLNVGKSETTNQSAYIGFIPNATAANSLLTLGQWGADDKLVINGSGNVGIGLTNPTHLLQLNAGDAYMPGGGSWGNSSDERLKTNITPVADALGKITQLNPVLFDWRNPSLHGGKAASGGFIAQQLMKVFPDFVNQSDCAGDDCKLTGGGKEYGMALPFTFDAYLVKAIQELKAINDNQAKTIEELKAENAKFEAYMKAHP